MADRCHMCLLLLIILCPLLTGTSGAEVFSSSGESVSLPCNNALSDCTSTTWNCNNNKHSETIELIAGGIKNNIERRERLSLGSDCSLNIKKVTHEDYGLYTCQQFVNGQQQGTDAPVNLHVLHISSSSSQTEIRSGSVTLSCQLHLYRVSCDTLVRSEGLQLIWVNQAGVNLMTDSRYQISFSTSHCISSMTTKLLNEDPNREFRCQVTQSNQLKTSATYTVKISAPTKTLTTVPSSKTTPTVNKPVTSTQPEIVIVAVSAVLAVLLPALILCVVCKKRGDIKRETNDSVVTNMNKYNGTKDTINISIHHTASANVSEPYDSSSISYSYLYTVCTLQLLHSYSPTLQCRPTFLLFLEVHLLC
ncbi:diverse immunoglobulin domain-containing protein 3.3 [Pimephales promelas]|nr:diverse immunoglobulin domain-containing protein 3.3 [Pimephales promelas]